MIIDQPINWFVSNPGKDKHFKSILKSISWQIVGTLDILLISYLTGELKIAISIGSIEVVPKVALYYFHEPAWAKATKS
jgi:uncharacterized membrane protein